MKTVAWLIAGFALLGLSALLESIGDMGDSAGTRLPLYLPAMAALIGAPFCFFRGIRSAISEMIGAGPAKVSEAKPDPARPRPARRIAAVDVAEDPEPFDADAVFARYMEKRAAQPPEQAAPASAPFPSAAAQRPEPATTRPGFGRKVV